MKLTTLYYLAGFMPSLAIGCVLPSERAGIPRSVNRRQTSTGVPIGTGDRYSAGTIAPRGVGSQTVTLTTILSVKEIASALKGLAAVYGVSTFTTPYTTNNGAVVSGGKVGGNGTCAAAYRVYLNAGIHARERGGPDGLLFFIGDLLYANKNNVGLKFGAKTYTAAQVKRALATGIVFVPLSNPDGVAYDQTSNSCWRKNRRPGTSIGVDLNRNFDFAWDPSNWAPSVRNSVASSSPSSEVYRGPSAFSEPETKNIKYVMDTYSKVRWFIDLHSFAGDILYSWGSDDNQSTNPSMNFLNSAYNSVRGIVSDTPNVGTGYGEYVPTAEGALSVAAANRMRSAMSTAGGRSYVAIPASDLYATSGASDDYSYSRHFADTSKNLIHGYTIEFGFGNSGASCSFYPTQAQHNKNLQEIGAGFMEMLLSAADLGVGDPLVC